MASTASRTPRWEPAFIDATLAGVDRCLLCGGSVFLRGLDLEHRPAAVVAAVRAGAVAALRLVAVRTVLELRKGQRLVCASIALPSVGDPALGHAHESRCSFHRACWSARVGFGIRPRRARRRAEPGVYPLSSSPSTWKPLRAARRGSISSVSCST